ncbi:MAG: hypothetical protein QM579_07625 [Desulfovibrio sp.]|uniref:hypothetical protein n=1 Tax=Desulfovibrio sp. TaxID=885 RepID=UPI0039E34CAD
MVDSDKCDILYKAGWITRLTDKKPLKKGVLEAGELVESAAGIFGATIVSHCGSHAASCVDRGMSIWSQISISKHSFSLSYTAQCNLAAKPSVVEQK